MIRPRRAPVLAFLVLVLVAGGLADRRSRSGPAEQRAGDQQPVAASSSARSSAWYCGGATGTPDGAAAGTVVVANVGTRVLRGTVSVIASEGEPDVRPIAVSPATQAVMQLQYRSPTPYLGAIVELDGGQAAVDLVTAGPRGDSIGPCASSASGRWYFADGVTTKDATEVLTLLNPFPEDAIVDVAFSTEDGETTPDALSGLAVRGRSIKAVNVGEFVQRRAGVTAAVVARSGRLVTHRFQSFDGTEGRKGVTVSLGARAPAPRWLFPEGMVADGLTERFHVFNPSADESEIRVSFSLESGEAEPLELTIPPHRRVTIVANDETRLPRGVPHAVTVEAINDVDMVAERTVDGAPPSGRSGVAFTLGATGAANRWLLPTGRTDEVVDEWLAVLNPGSTTATVSVTLFSDGNRVPVEKLQGLEIPAGQRRAFRLAGTVRPGASPLLVAADTDVVVERGLYGLKGAGFNMLLGVPLEP